MVSACLVCLRVGIAVGWGCMEGALWGACVQGTDIAGVRRCPWARVALERCAGISSQEPLEVVCQSEGCVWRRAAFPELKLFGGCPSVHR